MQSPQQILNTNNTNNSNSLHIPLTGGGGRGGMVQQPLTIPLPPPPPPPQIGPECSGCLNLINERYYLSVNDRVWHINCLRCSDCKLCLDSQQSCFAKDGFIYCKDDYFK